MKKTGNKAIALTSIALMVFSLLSAYPFETTAAPGTTMDFATGEIINFHSTVDMSFWSGVSILFGTGIILQFIEMPPLPNGVLEPCDVIQLLQPFSYIPRPCEWWEVLDPQGNPTGIEFHIDGTQSFPNYHIDMIYPGPIPYPYPPGTPFRAEKKIDRVEPCMYFVVHEPSGWYPAPCSWWEIMNPETHQPTGVEFHVDITNESCEFHIDEMIPGPYIPPYFPWHLIEARRKVTGIYPCDWFYILDPAGFTPDPFSWWEILDPNTAEPTGLEFHIDNVPGDGTFHVDLTDPPQGFDIPMSYIVRVRQKITTIEPCSWFEVGDLTNVPKTCTWWRIVRPDIGDVEFHVDQYETTTGRFHIDEVLPSPMQIPPNYQLAAEKKFVGISPCDWFRVESPNGFLPAVCSWWRITWPPQWAGVEFHVDSTNGIDKFHIDTVDPLPPGPTPPPWNVTAQEFTPPWYWKADYGDYAPSGMPDFDQRQGGAYNWVNQWGAWSHCGPVAVANSLWWLDSEFEPNPIPPPIINDGYPLVQSYGQWDDHDPLNVPPLVEHLAFLMDTDGRRTGLAHSGTNVNDMQAGLTHYLSWTGVNPKGDVNGDGIVNMTDMDIVTAAYGSSPGMAPWNLAADVSAASTTYPPVTTNKIDTQDVMLVANNMNKTGRFYEHTVIAPGFQYIEQEVEKCQDVVLLIGYWMWNGFEWYREPGGHYVTVAGVNSEDWKIAISDPVQDAFETGMIPEGRIPIGHFHMPPEPPYVTHNNAAFVSQDIYDVMNVTPPWSPCPGGNLMLANFASWRPAPPYFAVVESAVVTSPYVRDVAVLNASLCYGATIIHQGNQTCCFNATVANKGDLTETFNVTAYRNGTEIQTKNVTLTSKTNTTITFQWNVTGLTEYDYFNMTVYAWPVPTETNQADNTYVYGIIRIVHLGDHGPTDKKVRVDDVLYVAQRFGCDYGGGPNSIGFYYDPSCDLTCDGKIRIDDVRATAVEFGWG